MMKWSWTPNDGACLCFVSQMLEGFHSTVERYFGKKAQLPDVDMLTTEFEPGTRSFKLIVETPLAGTLTGHGLYPFNFKYHDCLCLILALA